MASPDKISDEDESLVDGVSDVRSTVVGCCKGFGAYTLRKLQEFSGLKLTHVQEVYWRAVQRRMVMGQLENLARNGKIIDYIPYELAEVLMSGDKAMRSSLNHLCDRWDILIAPPEKPPKRDQITRTVDIELEELDTGSPDSLITEGEPIEEPDTGGEVISEPLHPRDMYKYHMTKQDEEEDILEHKGGFWDQVCIAMKFLNEKRKGQVNPSSESTTTIVTNIDEVEDIDSNYDLEDISSDDDDSIDLQDIFFGKDLKHRVDTKSSDYVESTDTSWRLVDGVRKHFFNHNTKGHRPPWQFLHDIIPLRVSNFQFRYVTKERQAKLNKMWKKVARWPLFTYWVTFVQLFVMIFALAVYGFAPLRYTPYTERSLVLQADLQVQVAEKNITPNIWAGPHRDVLVLLGANYGPCMRRDKVLFQALESDRNREAEFSGCCVRRDSSSCVQVGSAKDCPTEIGLADFVNVDMSPDLNTSLYTNRAVCGTSPRRCSLPSPSVDSRWRSVNFTGWPICTRTIPVSSNDSYDSHLSCNVTGRPCCVGLQAHCIITSQEHCEFLDGHFHEDAFLCSQVNCLKDICGLTPFGTDPDQIQRLGLALFLHAGLFHLLMTILFNLYIIRDLEKYLGWLATASLYLGSGMGGNIISALFVPYSSEVGPAASQFGVISFFLVFIAYHWSFFYYKKALLVLFIYILLLVILFIIGLLPYVDNYARIGGFLFGLLLSFIHVHYIPPHDSMKELEIFKWKLANPKQPYRVKNRSPIFGKIILLVAGLVLVVPLFIFSFVWFYLEQDTWDGFRYLNCVIPTSLSDLCLDYGQTIRSRDIAT